MTVSQKIDVLKRVWVPPEDYDVSEGGSFTTRKFRRDWLQTYSPWLTYSQKAKAFCLYCVLFPPPLATIHGVLGSFVVRPYIRYKNMNEDCRNHAKSKWHVMAVQALKSFLEQTPVDVETISAHKQAIQEKENRQIITSIISTVTFCGLHDMPLRGKEQYEGIFEDLLSLRIEAGDKGLRQHFQTGHKNALYRSPQIQNEIIN